MKDYLENFSSDRSHMLKFIKNGNKIYHYSPPNYEPIINKNGE